ncbi:MAG: alpha/beta fold hydrolase [Planctomycetota bacterium]
MQTLELNGLTVRITGGEDERGGGDGPLVVLLHGYGAPGDDLVPLGRYLTSRLGAHVRCAFFQAPGELAGGFMPMRMWWPIDGAALEQAIAAGTHRDRSQHVPPELPHVRAQFRAALEELQERLGATAPRTILGGFSQGSMVSCDAFASGAPIGGLVVLSGTLLALQDWVPGFAAQQPTPVFQSHGTQDPLLSFAQAETLRDLLIEAGHDVTWVPFRGQHEIPPPVLAGLCEFVGGF